MDVRQSESDYPCCVHLRSSPMDFPAPSQMQIKTHPSRANDGSTISTVDMAERGKNFLWQASPVAVPPPDTMPVEAMAETSGQVPHYDGTPSNSSIDGNRQLGDGDSAEIQPTRTALMAELRLAKAELNTLRASGSLTG